MAKNQTERQTGSIRRLPSGRWQVRYTEDGLRKTAPTTFPTSEQADQWLIEYTAKVILGQHHTPARSAAPTFRSYSQTYLDRRTLKANTVRDYKQCLRDLNETFGDLPLDLITSDRVTTWYAEDTHGSRQRQMRYGLLHAIMREAIYDEIVEKNPCKVRGAMRQKATKPVTIATLDELDVMADNMPDRLKAALLLATWCSIRRGELLELRRSDIDIKAGTIRISRSVAFIGGRAIVDTPKSQAGFRTIAIPPHIIPDITAHLDAYSAPGITALVFPGENGTHLKPSALRWAWLKARSAAGRSDLRWHGLRHTGNTLAGQAGATDAELMARGGHSDKTAVGIYQHSTLVRDKAIAARMSELAQL